MSLIWKTDAGRQDHIEFNGVCLQQRRSVPKAASKNYLTHLS